MYMNKFILGHLYIKWVIKILGPQSFEIAARPHFKNFSTTGQVGVYEDKLEETSPLTYTEKHFE